MSLIKKIKSYFIKKEEPVTKTVVIVHRKKKLSEAELKAKQERANQILKEQLKKEREKQLASRKQQKPDTKKPEVQKSKEPKKKKIKISQKEQDAELLAETNETVLFIQATTKRLKVIEWRKKKKRIILNKEREIRRTHKGGFSQEKFQAFVDSQIAKTPEWVETNLKKPGVLRGPYQKMIIEANEEIETKINRLF